MITVERARHQRYARRVQLREILNFVRRHSLAVQASVSSSHAPQAAVVGIVVSDRFEMFFDTLESSRKCQNLRENSRIALVVGWDLAEGRTAQIEGVVDEPAGAELERLKLLYFERFPDGVERQSWPGITYVRVRPTWLRFSDFSGKQPQIVEFDANHLVAYTLAR
jgi:hypothetical protein